MQHDGSAETTLAAVSQLFARFGGEGPNSDVVGNAHHMLQAAAMARREGASEALVAAALLHDIGHWLHADHTAAAAAGDDDRHEVTGAEFLSGCFGPEVTEPIALHVAAKRYLCAVEPDYFARLSHGSVRSLEIQGGPMREAEAATFAEGPHAEAAIALRRWDEYGKVPDLAVEPFGAYLPLLRKLAGISDADEGNQQGGGG